MQCFYRLAALAQVVFETPQQTLQIVEQTLGIDQGSSLPILVYMHPRLSQY
jgi:hypothetical protein